jgi:hypothetical protein
VFDLMRDSMDRFAVPGLRHYLAKAPIPNERLTCGTRLRAVGFGSVFWAVLESDRH